MSKQTIDIGLQGNDGTGESIREAFRKVNENFNEIYAVFGIEGSINFTSLSDAPARYVDDLGIGNQFIISKPDGSGLAAKPIITQGLDIDTSGDSIILTATAASVFNDKKPKLGAQLDANTFTIGKLANIDATNNFGEDLVNQFNITHGGVGYIAANVGSLAVNKSYVDTNFIKKDPGGVVDGALRVRDEPAIPDRADPDYNDTLTSNYLSTEALPRKNTVFRGGDTMTGALTLDDHPGGLAGLGTPKGADDLQAATKFYVDNSTYASQVNLFVSTSAGDDTQALTPAGKEGRAWNYAYRSIGAAALAAENLMNLANAEPGPYRQTIGYTIGPDSFFSQVTSTQFLNGNKGIVGYDDAYELITENKEFIQAETIAYINSKYVNKLEYDRDAFKTGIETIVEAICNDLVLDTNYRSVVEARAYAANVLPSQISQIVAGLEYARDIITNYSYNEVARKTDIGLMLDAIGWDLVLGSNFQSARAGISFYSANATNANALNQTIGALGYVKTQVLALANISGQVTPTVSVSDNIDLIISILEGGLDVVPEFNLPPSVNTPSGAESSRDLLLGNIKFLQAEVIGFLGANYPTLGYSKETCKRDVKYMVWAVLYDLMYGGNSASVYAGNKYWLYSERTIALSELPATIAAVNYLSIIAADVIQNQTPATVYQPTYRQYKNSSLTQGSLRSSQLITLFDEIADIINSGVNSSPTQPTTTGITAALLNAQTSINTAKPTIENGSITYINANFNVITNPVIVSNLEGLFNIIIDAVDLGAVSIPEIDYVSPLSLDQGSIDARLLIIENFDFIKDETIEYLLTLPGFDFDGDLVNGEATYRKNIQYMIDAVLYDLTYQGNSQSVYTAKTYYPDGVSQVPDSTYEAFVRVQELGNSIVQNQTPTTVYTNPANQYTNMLLSGLDAIPTLNNLWNTVITIIDTNPAVTIIPINLVGFDPAYLQARTRVLSTKATISEDTATYLDETYKGGFTYDEGICYRDTGYLVDAAAIDIITGGTYQSVNAGKSYYRNTSAKAIAIGTQFTETFDAIKFAKTLVQACLDQLDIAKYQTEIDQYFNPALIASQAAIDDFSNNWDIVSDIIQLGYGAAPTPSFGSGLVEIKFSNGGNSYVDQGNPANIDLIPGKVLIGKTSGGNASIVSYDQGGGSNEDTLIVRLLQPIYFLDAENLDYAETVRDLQITIFVESGVYYEDYPIRLAQNVSIKGNDFRRTIVRPRDRVSQSPWRSIFFYRDAVIDGMQIGLLNTSVNYATATTATLSGVNGKITVTLTAGTAPRDWIGYVFQSGVGKAQIDSVANNVANCTVIYPFPTAGARTSGNWFIYAPNSYGRHYLSNPLDPASTPKNNRDIDVFLCNDATRVNNLSFQGHGGFAMVLDPEGQVLSKSPYGQVCSSFSGSINRKRWAGGQFVDGFAGRLRGAITNVSLDGLEVTVVGVANGGLNIRAPKTPCAFFWQGFRYQVNNILSYNSSTSTVVLGLDVNTPYSAGNNTINIEMGGNKSMLANDFAMVNDLGYGVVAANGALTEQVSTFTYYCYTHYWSYNGGQIRSVSGSNAHGVYALRSTGYDVTELPDAVSLTENLTQTAVIYKTGVTSSQMNAGDKIVYISNYNHIPQNISELEIDHSRAGRSVTRYEVNSITYTSYFLDPTSQAPVSGVPVVTGTGPYYVTYTIPTQTAPTIGVFYTIRGNRNASYNGNFLCTASTTSSITLKFWRDPGVAGPTGFATTSVSSGLVGGVNTTTIGFATQASAPFNIGDTVYVKSVTPAGVNGAWTVTACTTSTVQFAGATLGPQTVAGIISSTIISGQNVLSLNLSTSGNNDTATTGLAASLYDGQTINIKTLQYFKFDGIANVKPTRPSTALQFDDNLASIYRVIAYNLTDSTGEQLKIVGGSGQAVLTSDTSFAYYKLYSDPARVLTGDPFDVAKTMGASLGDIRIAVSPISDVATIDQINKGTYITSHGGRVHKISSYTPSTGFQFATLTSTGDGVTAIVTFPTQLTVPFANGSTITIANMSPVGYNGTYTVITGTTNSVSFLCALGIGPQTAAGQIYGGGVPSYITLEELPINSVSEDYTSITIANPRISTGTGPYYVTYDIPSQPWTIATDSWVKVEGNSNTGFNGTYQVAAGPVVVASGSSGTGSVATLTFSGGSVSTLTGTSSTGNLLTISSAAALDPGQSIVFNSVTQTPTAIATTVTTNTVTMSSVTGLVAGEPIVFTAVTQTPTFSATSSIGNLLTLDSTAGLVQGEPIVFTAVTQSGTATATSSTGNLVTLNSTTDLVQGESIVFTTAGVVTPTISSTSSTGNLVTVSSATGLAQGESFIPTAVTSNSTINGSATGSNQLLLASSANLVVGESFIPTAVTQTPNATTTTNNTTALTTSTISTAGVLTVGAGTTTNLIGSVLTGTGVQTAQNLTVTAATGNGTTATLTFATQGAIPFIAGQTITVQGMVQTAYNGTYTVLGSPAPSTTQVSFTSSATGTSTGTILSSPVYVVSNISGSGAGSTWQTNQTAMAAVASTSITGTNNLITVASTAGMAIGESIIFSGTTFGGIPSSTTPTLSTVAITGTGGQFSCSATQLQIGQAVTITGTFGGTGSFVTPAYVTGTTFYIIATNGSTTFTLSTSVSGTAIATTAGTPTGLTYTLGTAYYITEILTGTNQIAVSAALSYANITVSSTSGTLTTVAGSVMGGLVSGTTYYIAGLTGNYITVSTSPSLTPVTTITANSGGGLWTYIAGSVLGGLTSGATYYIASIASNQLTLSTSPTLTPVVTLTNAAAGTIPWTSSAGSVLGGLVSGTTYYIASIASNQITVSTSPTLTPVVTLTNGVASPGWSWLAGSVMGGITSGATYFIASIAGSTITVSSSATLSPVVTLTNGVSGTSPWTSVAGATLGGLTSGATYYILTVTPTNNTITVSTAYNGSTQALTTSAGAWTSVAGGTMGGITSGLTYYILTVNTGTNKITVSTSLNGSVQAVTDANGAWTSSAGGNPFAIGSYITVTGVTPTGYNGNFLVTNCTPTTVSYASTQTGSISVNGIIAQASAVNVNKVTLIYNDDPGVYGSGTTTISLPGTGINKPFSNITSTTLRVGYARGTTAQITTKISTNRATGHDFLDIGTGGYNTTNYPYQIYGNPAQSATGYAGEVYEEGVGRVFHVSTDQFGVFRVGRFFTVDQGTGSVTFSASIALSNLDGIGFKRGVVVSEFSTDATMTNNASDTVPVQSAIRGYIDKRLGIDHGGSTVSATNLVGPGYMPLNGILAMKASINAGGYNIQNTGTPINGSDAATKNYVDTSVALFNQFSELTDIALSSPLSGNGLVYDATTSKWKNVAVPSGDVSYTYNSGTNTFTTAIQNSVITNSMISNSAAIAQSKLNLSNATADVSGSVVKGIAGFDSTNFAATSGFVSIKAASITRAQMANLGNNSIMGNFSGAATTPQEVTALTVLNAGFDSKFTTSSGAVTYGGTSGSATITGITATGTANNIVKTDGNGFIDVQGLKIDTYQIIDTSSTTVNFTTPGSATNIFMSAVGTAPGNTTVIVNGTLDNSSGTTKINTITTGGPALTGSLTGTWQLTASSSIDFAANNTTLKTKIITTGLNTTRGDITGDWRLTTGSSLQATYADLAENYSADAEYEPGTVLVFGGDAEVTTTTQFGDSRVAGVVTTHPAYIMNGDLEGTKACVALQGRVPVKVFGVIKKGDLLTTAAKEGYACKAINPQVGTIIGKALADKNDSEVGVIEVAVGRV